MMSGHKHLLDTNIIISLFDGNKEIADKIFKSPQIYTSSVVLGELHVGINRVSNKAKHLKKLTEFLELCSILDIDSDTATHYGRCKALLFKKGKPIPSNDVWIAATALQHGLTLVSNDKHFKEIEVLDLVSWK